MKGLTKRQSEILAYIQDYIRNHQFSPSYREIMRHFELSSIGSVYKHIHILKRKGALVGEKQGRRSLSPAAAPQANQAPLEIEIPFIGHISAGKPIETFPHCQTIAVPSFLVEMPENTYVLRAKGDSLQEELISDGDLLLVEAKTDVKPGETVVALINHHDTIVKRFFPDGDRIKLTGHLLEKQPISLRLEDIEIQGIVISLIRLYRYTTRAG